MESIKPGITFEDNTGAIFLVKNRQVGQRTKHIDIRWHFLKEYEENGILKVVFVRSENNTKTVKEKILKTHVLHIRNGTLGCWRNWENQTFAVSGGMMLSIGRLSVVLSPVGKFDSRASEKARVHA
jgi:hypothetical protein